MKYEDNEEIDEDVSEKSSDINEEFKVDDEESIKNMTFQIERAFDPGRIEFKPSSQVRTSNSLWVIEREGDYNGNPIVSKSDKVRFRHMIRDCYISVEHQEVKLPGGGTNTISYISKTTDRNDPGTLFNINEIYISGKFMNNAKPTQLSQEKAWLARGDMVSNTTSYQCVCTYSKENATNWLISRYIPNSYSPDSGVMDREPLDIYVALTFRNYLTKYLNMMVVPSDSFASSVMPTAEPSDIDFYKTLTSSLTMFIQGFPITQDYSSVNVDEEVASQNEKLKVERQVLVREVGILQIAVLILDKLIKISVEGDKFQLMTKGTSKAIKKLQPEIPPYLNMGKLILHQIFAVVYQSIRDNPLNQIYVADFLPVLLTHLGTQEYAGKCVNEMLSKNMTLQETKIGKREITIFITKLRASKMNPMYLKLLQSCCSCQGEGVDTNQVKVADLLFEDLNDVIILLQADYLKLFQPNWNKNSIYLKWEPVAGSPIMGDELLYKGVPKLFLSWTTNSIEFSPLGLFGKLSVPIETLYYNLNSKADNEDDWLAAKASKNKKKSKAEVQKLAVAEYYISELYLCAEMCLDRNYIGMSKLQNLFPYNVLVALLKHNVSDPVKAAVVRMLQCLYVDRDPQFVTFLPRLTRLYSDICSKDNSELAVVDVAYINSFSLLQDFISEHVKEMYNSQWSVLSHRVLCLLNKLVQFGFYGTNERLLDLTIPLIQSLDRRKMQYAMKKSTSTSKQPKPKLESANSNASLEKQSSVEELDPTFEDTGNVNETTNEEERTLPWQEKVLNVLESMQVLAAVLILTLIAVALTIYQIITNESDDPGTPLYIAGIIILILYLIELVSRMYTTAWVRGQLWTFFSDPLNWVDCLVVLVDIVFLCLPTDGSFSGGYIKVLRLVRLVRLARLLKAVRIVGELHRLMNKTTLIEWKEPLRYSRTSVREIEAMIEAVDILFLTSKMKDDSNLSILIRQFYLWESGESRITPLEAFQTTLTTSAEMFKNDENFDSIICDLVMFKNSALVQGVLDILVGHYSVASNLLENFNSIQLLVSPQNERKFKLISQILRQLESNAETQELWGGLNSPEDRLLSTQTHGIIDELLDLCKVRLTHFSVDGKYKPDIEIQTLLGNLGAYDVFFKIFELLDTIEDPDEPSEADVNTKLLVKKCMNLMYWFTWGAKPNQSRAIENLDFFIDNLDENIDSHLVVQAIFYNNEENMRMCPKSLIEKVVQKICTDGRLPQYLFLLMSITNVGEKNIVENQFEVAKQLLALTRLQKVSLFLCPIDSKEYAKKVSLMDSFLGKSHVSIESLPLDLQYHLYLLDVLSCCTVGRANMSSIEAKVQAVFGFEETISAILDPRSILIVRIRLSLHLFNSAIEVELMIPGFEYAICVWNLLTTYPSVLETARQDLIQIANNPFSDEVYDRDNLSYLLVCLRIIQGFFSRYYDPTNFRYAEVDITDISNDFHITSENIAALLSDLFTRIKAIYDLKSKFLSASDSHLIVEALQTLNLLISDVDFGEEENKKIMFEKADPDDEEENQNDLEALILEKLMEFRTSLNNDEKLTEAIRKESIEFVGILDNVPFVNDLISDSELRYEPFIRKLVEHVSHSIEMVNNEKYLNPRCTRSTKWMMKIFRTVIENKWGKTINERDEDGGEEDDIACAQTVEAFNSCGLTDLCVDLIALGIDESLQIETIKMCVAMLYKEGGAFAIQEAINKRLTSKDSQLFFAQIKKFLQSLIEWHKWNDVVILEAGEDTKYPESIIVIRFWQLMSEGHYRPNQEITREQIFNKISINLLEDYVAYLTLLSRIPCRTSTDAAIRVFSTVLEVLQGPCVQNQAFLVLNTDLLETMNRILRAKDSADSIPDQEIELKTIIIDVFRGLLEGQPSKSAVYDRVISVLHFDIIQSRCYPIEIEKENAPQESEVEETFRIQCLVLLQSLCDYAPHLRKDLALPSSVPEDVGCVEVIWNGQLQRRFFHIPDICWFLANSSKDELVLNIHRNSIESKLHDFLDRASGLYSEVKHQQYLKSLNISKIFSISILDKITWFALYLVFIINILFLVYYSTLETGNAALPNDIGSVIDGLNILLIISASFTLILVFVVKVPVYFQSHSKDDKNIYYTLFLSLSEPMVLYYFVYLAVTIISFAIYRFWLSFLLLDILIKDPTAGSVLQAIIVPRKQIALTLVLLLFITYIYSFFQFSYFTSDFTTDNDDGVCKTLFGCFLYCFGYGLRSGGGIADFLSPSAGIRYIFDWMFYLVLNLIMLNVVFGIIIDTFGEMRADRDEKYKNTTETCFICSIDKQVFDRESDLPEGFKKHIKYDHNMWNYLFFIIHLWEQDKDDDDGLEWYIRKCVNESDLSWFPIKRAMCLHQHESEDDELRKILLDEITSIESTLNRDVEIFKEQLKYSLADIVHSAINKKESQLIKMYGGLDNDSSPGHKSATAETIDMNADRNLSIKFLRLMYLNMKQEDLKTISCRLVSEEGMYSVLATGVDNLVVAFEDSDFLVAQAVSFNVDRNFRIQILKGDGKVGASKFIAIVEVSIRTLLSSDGLEIELPFYIAEQDEPGILYIRSTSSFINL